MKGDSWSWVSTTQVDQQSIATPKVWETSAILVRGSLPIWGSFVNPTKMHRQRLTQLFRGFRNRFSLLIRSKQTDISYMGMAKTQSPKLPKTDMLPAYFCSLSMSVTCHGPAETPRRVAPRSPTTHRANGRRKSQRGQCPSCGWPKATGPLMLRCFPHQNQPGLT